MQHLQARMRVQSSQAARRAFLCIGRRVTHHRHDTRDAAGARACLSAVEGRSIFNMCGRFAALYLGLNGPVIKLVLSTARPLCFLLFQVPLLPAKASLAVTPSRFNRGSTEVRPELWASRDRNVGSVKAASLFRRRHVPACNSNGREPHLSCSCSSANQSSSSSYVSCLQYPCSCRNSIRVTLWPSAAQHPGQ